MPLPPYLVVVWVIALVLLVACIAAAIVEAIGRSRLAAWLRLPSIEDDER